jgi:hypothetical protein
MYKFYEIFKIFNNCKNLEEIEACCSVFVFLLDEKYLTNIEEYDYIVKQSHCRFRQLINN